MQNVYDYHDVNHDGNDHCDNGIPTTAAPSPTSTTLDASTISFSTSYTTATVLVISGSVVTYPNGTVIPVVVAPSSTSTATATASTTTATTATATMAPTAASTLSAGALAGILAAVGVVAVAGIIVGVIAARDGRRRRRRGGAPRLPLGAGAPTTTAWFFSSARDPLWNPLLTPTVASSPSTRSPPPDDEGKDGGDDEDDSGGGFPELRFLSPPPTAVVANSSPLAVPRAQNPGPPTSAGVASLVSLEFRQPANAAAASGAVAVVDGRPVDPAAAALLLAAARAPPSPASGTGSSPRAGSIESFSSLQQRFSRPSMTSTFSREGPWGCAKMTERFAPGGPTTAITSIVTRIPWRPILQRLPGFWLLGVFLFGLFGPAHLPVAFCVYFVVLHAIFIGSSLRTAYGIYHASRQVVLWSKTDWLAKYCTKTGAASGSDLRHDLPFDDVNHVIVVPNYKENLDTLCETLDVLASHSRALTQYRVCLAMEESEAGSEKKAIALVSRYTESFLQIVYTIHPTGLEGEIRGKASNVSWAAKQMARKSKNHRADLLTVMDADTCFAEDYFNSINYFYCVATPEQRRLQMFTPSTIFDRNAKDVPVLVRCADMLWSVAVMSNLFPSCPVRFPCSAYSLSMDLAVSVGFWDTEAEAMGEDMHMYLKCYFSTEGRVRVEPIFSPASCCNIEGKGVVGNVWARFNQAKRHLWGSLDFGYALRRALLGVLTPGFESAVSGFDNLKNRKKSDDFANNFKLTTLGLLLHRLLEAHIVVGHLFVLLIMSSILIPMGPAPSFFTVSYWDALTTQAVSPILLATMDLCGWLRFLSALPLVLTIVSYERYHHWVGHERWRQSAAGLDGTARAADRVQPLGLRSQLSSARSAWNLLDWVAVPVSGLLFQCAPQVTAQIMQLWTDRLDYTVAVKPTLQHLPAAAAGAHPPGSTPVDVVEVFGHEDVVAEMRGHRIDADSSSITVIAAPPPPPRSTSLPLSPKSVGSSPPAYSEIDVLSPLALELGGGSEGGLPGCPGTLPLSGKAVPALPWAFYGADVVAAR
ncbi:hypothetical protein HK405_004625 [Cladochytrium tenue]|nr:hypothetical protein HK405_004625 [Cladochytrium tenue]